MRPSSSGVAFFSLRPLCAGVALGAGSPLVAFLAFQRRQLRRREHVVGEGCTRRSLGAARAGGTLRASGSSVTLFALGPPRTGISLLALDFSTLQQLRQLRVHIRLRCRRNAARVGDALLTFVCGRGSGVNVSGI